MQKYSNVRSGGFASKLEAAVFKILKFKEAGGLIKNIQCQQSVEMTRAKIRCKIDFCYEDCVTGRRVWVEAKGMETDRWRIIQKLWEYYGAGQLLIYRGHYAKPFLAEIIEVNKGGLA